MRKFMYLYSIEYCDEKYCEFTCTQRLFISLDEAKRIMSEEVADFIERHKDEYDFKIEAIDGMSVKFQEEYDSPTHFSNHCWFTIEEIVPEDGEGYNLYDDYYHMEVEAAFESITNDDSSKYPNLIEQLVDLVKNDKCFVSTFDNTLAEIISNNDEVKQIIAKNEASASTNA